MQDHNFPRAAHSYFRITNQREAKAGFFKHGAKTPPRFTYSPSYNAEVVHKRLKLLGTQVTDDELSSLNLVLTSLRLQDDDSSLGDFTTANIQRYGDIKKEYTVAILNRLRRAVAQGCEQYLNEADKLLGGTESIEHGDLWPSEEFYSSMRNIAVTYMKDLIKQPVNLTLVDLLRAVMDEIGLFDGGWKLVILDDMSHARVSHRMKQVRVGAYYTPRTVWATRRIVAHEIYGHAARGYMTSEAEAEGFAILMEQLLAQVFKPRRMFRFLAASLARGYPGQPRDFVEVYEIIWRLIMSTGRYKIDDAQSHAFDECARVFRGGRPDLPGAVFIKDKIYFEANINMWRSLEAEDMSYNTFMEIASGERRVLR